MSKAKLLIVDDNAGIRTMLRDWLSDDYEVLTAGNGHDALEILGRDPVDLVMSDINMPGINGFETLRRARALQPGLKVALITDYDVDSYIKLALEHDITNIIVKTAPFDIAELFLTLDNLLTGRRVFGLANYLGEGASIQTGRILSSADIETFRELVMEAVRGTSIEERLGSNLRMVFEEIASNAVYHAYGYTKTQPVALREDQKVEVTWGSDSDKFGFSVIDHSGRLSKEIVLRKILRAMSIEGVLDPDGRGLFLTRSFSDRFIINIKRGELTEILVLNSFASIDKNNKPLYVNEL